MKTYVYFFTDGIYIKIGVSINPCKRLKQLKTGNSCPIYMLGYMYGDYTLEKQLHKQFKKVNLEWFEATDSLIAYINDNLEDGYVDWLNGRLVVYQTMRNVNKRS